MRGAWVVLFGCGLAALTARDAHACSFAPATPHTLDADEQGVDTTPPSAPGEITSTVSRGTGPESDGCGTRGTSCDGSGSIGLHLVAATDDRTAAESLGYRLDVVAGEAPPGWNAGPLRTFQGDTLWFNWSEDEDEASEPIRFTLRVRAVDLAGNEGPPRDVQIVHGGDNSGCEVGGRTLDLSWGLVFLALLFVSRARRDR